MTVLTLDQSKAGMAVADQTFGLNRMDLLQREGKYPLPPQASKTIMGVEFAGVVTKIGNGCSKFTEGDKVFGLAYGVGDGLIELTAGRVCRVYCLARAHAPAQAGRFELGTGGRTARELDDW
jgi:NADPH:quinone reductase-like Zn-dependent oxidoreductase